MQVCDIDRTSEVRQQVTMIFHPADKPAGEGSDVEIKFEVSDVAAAAFRDRDWGTLLELTPKDFRKKNPARAAGAKQGAETRRRNAEDRARLAADAAAAEAAGASGPPPSPEGNGDPDPA